MSDKIDKDLNFDSRKVPFYVIGLSVTFGYTLLAMMIRCDCLFKKSAIISISLFIGLLMSLVVSICYTVISNMFNNKK